MTEPSLPHIATLPEAQRYVVLAASIQVGLIPALEGGGAAPDELAGRLGLAPRATNILLRALAESGVVAREGDRYRLTDRGRDLARAMGTLPLAHHLHLLGNWTRLPEVARSGRPVPRDTSPEGAARFMQAMASRPPAAVEAVAREVTRRIPPGRIVDLGGGPGLYSRAFIAQGWRATLVDQKNILAHVREAYGLENFPGLSLFPADFTEDLPPGDFEAALLANVTHIFDADQNRRLLARLAAAYPSLRAVAVVDFVVGRTPGAELFAVNMLVHTEHGNTYALDDYRAWTAEAGFPHLESIEIPEGRHHLLVAKK